MGPECSAQTSFQAKLEKCRGRALWAVLLHSCASIIFGGMTSDQEKYKPNESALVKRLNH
jgi:hypothetical protein